MNSRRKGKVGELEAARALREHLGLPVTRAAQHSGKEQADLRGTPGIHWEVKRRRKIGAARFMDQAMREARVVETCDIPVVLMREDGHPFWTVMVPLTGLELFIERLQRARALPPLR